MKGHFDNVVIRSHGFRELREDDVVGEPTGAGTLYLAITKESAGLGYNDLEDGAKPLSYKDVESYKAEEMTNYGKLETIDAISVIGYYANISVTYTGCNGAILTDNTVKSISGLPSYKGKSVYGNQDLSRPYGFDKLQTKDLR
jgi:hypothetical protein